VVSAARHSARTGPESSGTLDRSARIRNRVGEVGGPHLCRVGGRGCGTVAMVPWTARFPGVVLLLGPAWRLANTALREIAGVLATTWSSGRGNDTSNEISGDGDITPSPHRAGRRMQVARRNFSTR